MIPNQHRRGAWVAAGLIALVCIGFVLWQWRTLAWTSWKYDEGLNVIKAQLVEDGYRLYHEIWSDQPPLFTLLLTGAFRLAGDSVRVGRLLVLGLAVLGLASAAWLAWRRLGAVCAVVTVTLLATLPHYQELARLIMIGLPAIALGLAALALAEVASRSKSPGWVAVAGGVMALSWLVKPVTAPWLAPALVLVWMGAREGPTPTNPWRLLRWYGLGLLVPLMATALIFGPQALGGQVVGTLLEARAFHGLVPSENLGDITAYLLGDRQTAYWGMLLVAAAGLVGLWLRRRRADALWMGLWLLAGLAAVALQSPLRRHHLLLLMPPLVMLAGVGVQLLFTLFRNVQKAATPTRVGLAALALVTLVMVAQWPGWLVAGVELRAELLTPNQEALDRQAAIALLRQRTPPDGLVITDDPMLAFVAGRHVPPELAVPSARRVEAGALTSEGLLALCLERRPAAVIFFEQRLTRLTDFAAWVRGNWQAVGAYADDRWAYLPLDDGRPFVAQPARSEAGLALLGASFDTLAVEPGATLTLDIRLRADRDLSNNYTLFVHLLDEQGHNWGQKDVLPLDQRYPVSAWGVGETIAQRVVIPVAADAPAGEKLLAVGFYGTDGRLALVDGQGQALASGQVILSVRPVVRWQADVQAPASQVAQQATLGGIARLVGYDLAPADAEPRTLNLTLHWQCLQGTTTSYTVFVHVLNGQGVAVAQRDQRPGDGAFPTTGWTPGEYLADVYRIPVPAEAGDGPFSLAVGMYDLSNGQRLPTEAGGVPLPDGLVRLSETITLR